MWTVHIGYGAEIKLRLAAVPPDERTIGQGDCDEYSNETSDITQSLPQRGLRAKRVTDAEDEVKDEKDNTHGRDLVGNSAGTLEYKTEQFVLEELDVSEDDGHTVDDRVNRERQVGSRDQNIVDHTVVFVDQL